MKKTGMVHQSLGYGVLAGIGGLVITIWLILRGPQSDNGQEEEMATAGESS